MKKKYEFCLLNDLYEEKDVIEIVRKAVKLTKEGYDVTISKL